MKQAILAWLKITVVSFAVLVLVAACLHAQTPQEDLAAAQIATQKFTDTIGNMLASTQDQQRLLNRIAAHFPVCPAASTDELDAAKAMIAALTKQVADLSVVSAQVAEIEANCPTCVLTVYNVIHGNAGEVSNILCCGPSTVPPTPEVPAGTAILYITHEIRQ